MADSIYSLAVRLSLEGVGVTAAANAMMRQFASLEGSARSLDRTVNGLRFTLNTGGAQVAADELMQTFRQLETSGTKIGGMSGTDLALGLQGYAQGAQLTADNLDRMTKSAEVAQARADSLTASLNKMQVVNQRGTPGTTNPLSGMPFADTPGNRLYEYTRQEQIKAQRQATIQNSINIPKATTTALDSYNLLQGQVVDHANALQAEQERQAAQFNTGMGLTMAGALFTGVGGAGVSFFKKAAQDALDYNGVMTTVRLNTGATADEMQRLRDMTLSVGLTNQMSETDVAKIMRAETQTGVTNPTLLATLTPHIANLAEVANFTRGADRSETATVGVQLAHLFGTMGVTDPVAMGKMIDLVGRASQVTPGSLQQFDTLISQFIGNTRLMYPNQDQLVSNDVEVAMVESFLGQKGRGGTGFSSMISRMAGNPSFRSVTQRKKLHDVESLGGQDFFQNGQLVDFRTQVQILETAYKNSKSPQAAASMFNSAFGAVGTRVAGLLADPRTMQALDLAEAAIKNIPSMQSYQQQINQTPQGQINQANANLNTLMTEIGTNLLPILVPLADAFARLTGGIASFAHYHPLLTGMVAQFLALTSVMLLVGGPLLLLIGSIALMAPLLAGITLAGMPLVAVFAAIAVGVPALVVLFMNLDSVLKALAKNPLLDFFIGTPLRGVQAIGDTLGTTAQGIGTGDWGKILFGQTVTNPFGDNSKHIRPHGQADGHWELFPTPHWQATGGGGAYPKGGPVHVNVGGIHVHAQPHHDAHQIAHEVEKVLSNKIGQASRYGNLLPAGLTPGSMGY